MNRVRDRIPNVLRRPEQGWSSLVLLMGILVLLAVSVTDARLYALGDADPGAALVVMMIAAGLLGYVLARSSLGVVRSHLLGATVGASLLLLFTGSALQPDIGLVPTSLDQLGDTMVLLNLQVVDDLEAMRLEENPVLAVVPFLILGGICWTTAQFSTFSVFRYVRGGPAVMATGAVLFLNIGLRSFVGEADRLSPLLQLALFSALAMLLLMRLQLTHQGYQWARRHIADTGEVARLFLRTGTAFVIIAVVGASTLTITATTKVDPPSTDQFDDVLNDLGSQIADWLPAIGVPPKSDQPTSIPDSLTVQNRWDEPQGVAFRARVPGGLAGNYWFLNARAQFDGWTWRDDVDSQVSAAANARFGRERRSTLGKVELEGIEVIIEGFDRTKNVLSPASPYLVSAATFINSTDGGDNVANLEFQNDSTVVDEYSVSALAWAYDDSPRALTAADLMQAEGDDADPRYLQGAGSDEASGERTRRLADRIERNHDTRYERVVAVQNRLRGMAYSTDLGSLCADGSLNIPECLLEHEQGFCQYYASTMVMVLREMDIPARLVEGYLPGVQQEEDGFLQVDRVAFHAWVEAYFPGFGWIRFDPTPPTQQLLDAGSQGTEFDQGEEPPDSRPTFGLESFGPDDSLGPEITEEPVPEEGCLDCEPPDDGAVIALIVGGGIAGLLLVSVFGLLFYRLRRLPGGNGALAYSGIVSLATRLGYGPHPAQTEYEYASSLGETLPTVRDDLYVVADSRVQTTYGRQLLDAGRQSQLRRAYSRIRTALLRLSIGRRHSSD